MAGCLMVVRQGVERQEVERQEVVRQEVVGRQPDRPAPADRLPL